LNSAGNRRVLPYLERSEVGAARKPKRWVVLESPAIVDGSDLSNASAIPVPGRGANNYEIQFSLDKTGAEKFGAWTGANINEYLGVVLNDEVRSIAAIMAQIFDQGVISGGFTKQSAEDLALVLRSGALPAPIRIVRERGNKE
jgi:preprotein translocase subunit SecD